MTYTDYFNQPVAVGDRVVYPIAPGSSGARMQEGVIDAIIPLIPHRDGNGLMREDQQNRKDPTKIRASLPDEKKYVLRLMVKSDQYIKGQGYIPTNRRISVTNVKNIVKAPA